MTPEIRALVAKFEAHPWPEDLKIHVDTIVRALNRSDTMRAEVVAAAAAILIDMEHPEETP